MLSQLKNLPRTLTLKELYDVAVGFNPTTVGFDENIQIFLRARLGKDDFIEAIKAMAGENAIRAFASDEEANLNNRAIELSKIVTKALQDNDFSQANKLQGELGDISAQKLALVDTLIEQKLAEMYGDEQLNHLTQAVLWYQDKGKVREFLAERFGFTESTGELVLLPVGEAPKKPFTKADANLIAICYPAVSPKEENRLHSRVLYVIGFLSPEAKPTTLYRNVSVFIGKNNSNNATKSVSAFAVAGWKVVVEKGARSNG